MSGSRRSSRMTSGRWSAATRSPRPRGAASSVRSPAARSTSRASFRFFSLSSTMRTSGTSASGPLSRACGEGDVTAVSSARADPARARRGQLPRPRGLRGACSTTRDDFEIAAVCDDLDSLLAAVDAERPDVVVTDIRMPPGEHGRGNPGGDPAARDEPRGRCRRAQPVRDPDVTCSRFWRAEARDVPTF